MMANESREVNVPQRDVAKHRERAHRILDAATALILRWGYNKTTIDDIAKEAGVAKGTIYLHWKTRDELFKALIRRERLVMAVEIKNSMMKDPEGPTLRGIVKHSALVLMKRPLMKAVLLRDMDVLGRLAHDEHTAAAHIEKMAGFATYLEFLREHGLVRTDLSLPREIYMFSSIFMGFFLTVPLMPKEFAPSDHEIADLVAETVHRTLEAERSISPQESQGISLVFMQYLDHATEIVEEQLRTGIEPQP